MGYLPIGNIGKCDSRQVNLHLPNQKPEGSSLSNSLPNKRAIAVKSEARSNAHRLRPSYSYGTTVTWSVYDMTRSGVGRGSMPAHAFVNNKIAARQGKRRSVLDSTYIRFFQNSVEQVKRSLCTKNCQKTQKNIVLKYYLINITYLVNTYTYLIKINKI